MRRESAHVLRIDAVVARSDQIVESERVAQLVHATDVFGIDSVVAAQGREYVARVPIITMRLAAINGRGVAALLADSSKRESPWALRREYRSTFRSDLTETEKVLEGTWYGEKPTPAGAIPPSRADAAS